MPEFLETDFMKVFFKAFTLQSQGMVVSSPSYVLPFVSEGCFLFFCPLDFLVCLIKTLFKSKGMYIK